MYSLEGVEKTSRAIISYVTSCMQEKKLGATELKEYERQAKAYDFTHLINVSQEYLDMLNEMDSQQNYTVRYSCV